MIKPILKRGEFTQEVLSVVVAVAGILLIGFLGVKLYNFFSSQDERNAGAFLDGLKAKIDALDETDYCNQIPQASPPNGQLSPPECVISNTFALRGVEGWFLVAWNKDVPLDDKPQKCFDKNCLCLCKDKPDKDNCQERGVCRDIDRPMFLNFTLNYSFDTTLKKVQELGEATFSYYRFVESNCTYLANGLMPFNVTKKQEHVTISYNYGYYTNPQTLLFSEIAVGETENSMFSKLKQCVRFIKIGRL